jgi:hypothetical protein
VKNLQEMHVRLDPLFSVTTGLCKPCVWLPIAREYEACQDFDGWLPITVLSGNLYVEQHDNDLRLFKNLLYKSETGYYISEPWFDG